MVTFTRDPEHWLFRFSPREWIRAGLSELRRAEAAYAAHDLGAGLAGVRRAAGMALNAALIAEPSDTWGRSYVDHLRALQRDATAPQAVRDACSVLLDAQPPNAGVIMLRGPRTEAKIVDAARDVMAHAYAVAVRSGALDDDEPVSGLMEKADATGASSGESGPLPSEESE